MAMSYIFVLFLVLSLGFGAAGGVMADVSSAILTGAENGVQLCITLAGPLCLWSGVAKLMECSGLSDKLAAVFRPVLRRLFPTAAQDAPTLRSLTGNVTANLLGLGNAATPLGIDAVQRMQASACSAVATDEMCRLIVMNTASIQLLPTTVAAVRSSLGAAAPFSILPAVWVTSICSVSAGLLAASLFARLVRK